MTETKQFPANVLLSVTTGRLLTRPKDDGNGIEDIYKILGWMTRDEPYTHQLGRFMDECSPWLIRWFPELSQVNLERLDQLIAEDRSTFLDRWLAEHADILRPVYDVPRIPHDDHTVIDPVQELVGMIGPDKVIVADL